MELVKPLWNHPGDTTNAMLWVGKLTLWLSPRWERRIRVTHWRNGLYWAEWGCFSFRWGMSAPLAQSDKGRKP